LVQTCFRGNDFATIKNFRPKFFDENFWFKPVFEEMILQSSKILDQKIFDEILFQNCFRGNDFATIKNFRPKIFDEHFWFKPIFEEMILQP